MEKWCREHQLVPANGQASERVSERSIRYYRTLGLLDAPEAGGGFSEIHRLQLIALRILQTEGLPLRRIRVLLHGRNREDLLELQSRATASRNSSQKFDVPSPVPQGVGTLSGRVETWKVMPIDSEFSLVSKTGRELDAKTMESVRQLLSRGDPGKGGRNESNNV